MGGNDISYRVQWILSVCFFLDVVLFILYLITPLDAVIYLTSWSHLFSFSVRAWLTHEYYCCSTKGNIVPNSTRERSLAYWFHVSSILLYAILVTFFVVLIVDDTIMRKRLNVFELPHYKYIDPNGTRLAMSTYDNRPYLREMEIDGFHSLGKMVAYNNIRHVFPAVVHLVITYELRTTHLAVRVDGFSSYAYTVFGVLLFPILHCGMANIVSPDGGERDIYDCDPALPALAMIFSTIAFAILQLNLVKRTDTTTTDTSTPDPPPYPVTLPCSNRSDKCLFLKL
jgi:hypothetical protein